MGNLATPEFLIARWGELCRDPLEVWIVAEDGSIRYFTASGEQPKSGFPVEISLPPPIK